MTGLQSIDDLLATSAKRLIDFLHADLDLGFTFVELAQTEQKRGDSEGVERCRHNALRALETVAKLETLLQPGDTKNAIVDRRAELERTLSLLR